MRLHLKLSALGLLVMGLGAGAQPLPAPLLEATKMAIQASPDVQEKWKAFRATEHSVSAAKSQWLPRVDLTANAGRESRRTPGTDYGTFPIRGAEISLTQLLFDGGVASSAIRGADIGRLVAYYDLLDASESIALGVTRAYLDLLRARELVTLATENYAEHKRTSNLLQERADAAVARRSDLEQAVGRLAQAEAALVDETTGLRNAAVRYQRLVGVLPPDQLPSWPETQKFAQLPSSTQATLEAGISTNPALRAALQNVRAAEEALSGRKSAYFPVLQARILANTNHNLSGVRGNTDRKVAELVLQQNIYRGGADAARETQAAELAARANALFEQTCREVGENLSVAYKDTYTLDEKTRLLDDQRLATEKTRVAYRQQFDIGQRTLLDLLDTQKEYFDSQRSYVNARYSQLAAEARTLAAMGQLVTKLSANATDRPTPTDLGLDAAEMDPSSRCGVKTTVTPSLAEVLAGLAIPERARPADPSYVALLPNPDGSVGKVIVEGSKGQQTLSEARSAAGLSGESAPFKVSEADIQRDFGDAMKAQPPLPQKYTLYFDQGSTRLSAQSRADWPKLLADIQARKTVDITVAGHTDTVSSDRINDALARKRAESVAKMLRDAGVKSTSISIESYGSRQLEVQTPAQTNEPRNRRAVVTVR
jgi:adhesin transport system outer membrane protein